MKGADMSFGDAAEGDPEAERAPLLPEYDSDPSEPDFGSDMADAIVAARRDEFAALTDLNEDVNWKAAARPAS